jgi:hypothetical protein
MPPARPVANESTSPVPPSLTSTPPAVATRSGANPPGTDPPGAVPRGAGSTVSEPVAGAHVQRTKPSPVDSPATRRPSGQENETATASSRSGSALVAPASVVHAALAGRHVQRCRPVDASSAITGPAPRGTSTAREPEPTT